MAAKEDRGGGGELNASLHLVQDTWCYGFKSTSGILTWQRSRVVDAIEDD